MPIDHSGDGWGYACEIIKGNFLSPHHLLYKPFMRMFLNIHSENPLIIFTMVNLLISIGCLIVFDLLLKLRQWTINQRCWSIVFVAFCFSFIRYSAENEVYILPLFFALISAALFEKDKLKLSIFFSTLAVLFHQSYVFWLIAFSFPLTKKSLGRLAISCLTLIVIYSTAAFYYKISWYKFPFYDVHQGQVQLIPGINNLVLGAINFIRTFVQVHGEIPSIISQFYSLKFFYFIILIAFPLLIIFYKFRGDITSFKFIKLQKSSYLLAFILHFLFAIYSVGNAEFMVMLPFLGVLSIKWPLPIKTNLLKVGIVLIAIWNSMVYSIPHSFNSINYNQVQIQTMNAIKDLNLIKPNCIIVCEKSDLIINRMEYNQLTKKNNPKVSTKLLDINDISDTTAFNYAILEKNKNIDRYSLMNQSFEFENHNKASLLPLSKRFSKIIIVEGNLKF